MKCIGRIVTVVAVCAMLTASYAAQAESRSPISDIQLGQGGTFRGQVVDRQGQPLVDREVTLRQGEQTVARAKTDTQGHFVVSGLNGGVYTLQAAGQTSAHRLWPAQAAPPSARRGVMIVSGPSAVRGQAAALGGLGGVGAAAAVATGGYFLYDEVINDDDSPAS